MAAKKTAIARDWFTKSETREGRQAARLSNTFEQTVISSTGELPQLITMKELSEILKVSLTTIKDLVNPRSPKIRTIKVAGRRMTTPEWIAEYLRSQMRKK